MDTDTHLSKKIPAHTSHPLVDIVVSILIPSLILMKLSGEHMLGVSGGLLTALAFPLGWGTYELITYKKYNVIALFGLISVLLTGGIGLLRVNTQWLAVKEAAIPGIIGIAILISARSRYPFIKALLMNPSLFNVEKIHQKLLEHTSVELFEARLVRATYLLSGTFFFSSAMNYILAKWMVTSPTGSIAFNEELGRLTLFSYPIIALPAMMMTMAIAWYLWRNIRTLTGLTFEDALALKLQEKYRVHDGVK
ncbi:MFS transporter [Candidatus Uhrbacteria bacterium]|nr:MFS transporter [Candidatus Uhrbacteria bacterium]